MRFELEPVELKGPQLGDFRTRSKFVLDPRIVTRGKIGDRRVLVWLESIEVDEEFVWSVMWGCGAWREVSARLCDGTEIKVLDE